MDAIEQIEKDRDAGGNTGSPRVNLPSVGSKRPIQSTYWCFTFNNHTMEQVEQMEQVFRHECKWYVFQEEVGANGTPHLQGTLCLKVKQRMTQLKHINTAIHWEATKCVKASLAYCTKAETSTGRIWHYGIEVPQEIVVEQPRGWQLEVMNIIAQEPDRRTIHWFWDRHGNVGKTSLCKYLVVKHNALMLTGKSSDMYNMLAKFPSKRKIILVDVPRSSQDFINYGAIEQIKNGLVFSGKYEGAQVVFNSPHVFVFANQEPDINMMSRDRWNIVHIDRL